MHALTYRLSCVNLPQTAFRLQSKEESRHRLRRLSHWQTFFCAWTIAHAESPTELINRRAEAEAEAEAIPGHSRFESLEFLRSQILAPLRFHLRLQSTAHPLR